MISLRGRYKTAGARVEELRNSAPPDEAFVMTVFFVQKIIRRTLLQLVIWKGMTPPDAMKVVKRLSGLWRVIDAWPCYDPSNRVLETIIGKTNLNTVTEAAKKRNAFLPGSGNEGQKAYRKAIPPLIAALDNIKEKFEAEYGYYGWRGLRDSARNKIKP
jgi:hypothetical protein